VTGAPLIVRISEWVPLYTPPSSLPSLIAINEPPEANCLYHLKRVVEVVLSTLTENVVVPPAQIDWLTGCEIISVLVTTVTVVGVLVAEQVLLDTVTV
jgi:hypothetical protein